jgi:hypothetical protein
LAACFGIVGDSKISRNQRVGRWQSIAIRPETWCDSLRQHATREIDFKENLLSVATGCNRLALTLNQRVEGSSPSTPTSPFKDLRAATNVILKLTF